MKVGSTLGTYQVLAKLGSGGMGEVYLATDTRLKRHVALKVLPAAVAEDPERIARLQREAEILAKLSHPHIATLHGVEDAPLTGDGPLQTVLVMEYVQGDDLAQRIARGRMRLDEALDVARQIADGLEAAHEHGIVHRDLKPANVRVRQDGTVKVIDFGIAKAVDPLVVVGADQTHELPVTGSAHTALGVILGTAPYMAPEQLSGKPADRRADIWAFGCLLYEMLTARRAFPGDDAQQVMTSVLAGKPDLTALAGAPLAVRQLIERCLQKDPRRRLRDIGDARIDLEAWLGRPPDGHANDAASLSDFGGRWRGHVAWIAAALALLLGGAAGYWYSAVTATPGLPVAFEVVTPTTNEPLSFALSPDGRQLVYVAVDAGVPKLWIRLLDQTAARALHGSDGAMHPFWAPTSDAVAFFANGKLKRIDLLGANPPRELATAPNGRGGSWGTGNVIVFAPSTAGPLMRVSASGGAATIATTLAPGQNSHRWPQVLPDGHRFLFTSFQARSAVQGTYLADLNTDRVTRVVSNDSAPLFVAPNTLLIVARGSLTAVHFDPNGGVMSGEPVTLVPEVGVDTTLGRAALSVSDAGSIAFRTGLSELRQLIWVDRKGTPLGTVGAADANALSSPQLSPDERRIGVTRSVEGNVDAWTVQSPGGGLGRLTADASVEMFPIWARDGRFVVFGSNRGGTFDLFQRPPNGPGDARPVLETQEVKAPMDLSADGRVLLYAVQTAATGVDLMGLRLDGNGETFPVVRTPFEEAAGQFSPDGKWVAYQSTESGRMEVYVRPFPTPSGSWQVSNAGGSQPRWSRDGTELYYVSPDHRLMAVPVVTEPGGDIAAGTPSALFPLSLPSGTLILPAVGSRPQYDVAADGRFLVNAPVVGSVTPPIEVRLHWRASTGGH